MNKEEYYDLLTNKTFIRGYENFNVIDAKHLINPDVFPSIYIITQNGQIYCVADDLYLRWEYEGKYPYVNLLCKRKEKDKSFTKKRFLIKDLMAYSYIKNPDSYLERGCKVVNIDGNPNNCKYDNIIFLDEEKFK